MKSWVRLLTNESFVGCISLVILGVAAAFFGYKEGLAVTIGGIAGLLKGQQGQD